MEEIGQWGYLMNNLMRHIRVVCCLLLLPSVATAPPDDRTVPNPELDNARARHKRVAAEYDKKSEPPWKLPEWAGNYSCSIMAGLLLMPDTGFVAWGDASLQFVFLINHGDVKEVEGRTLHLNLAIDPSTYADRGEMDFISPPIYISNQMIYAPGKRFAYLVPVERMRQFCNDVNGGLDLANRYYSKNIGPTRDTDPVPWAAEYSEGPPTDPVDVPHRFREYLLPTPITARVVWVSGAETENAKWYGSDRSGVRATLVLEPLNDPPTS